MHLIFLAPIPFDSLHQRPQKLAEGFVRETLRVTYVEPSGIREYLDGRRRGLIGALARSLLYHARALTAMAAHPRRGENERGRRYRPGGGTPAEAVIPSSMAGRDSGGIGQSVAQPAVPRRVPADSGRSMPHPAADPGDRPGVELATMPLVIPPNRVNSAFFERLAAAVYREFLIREVYTGAAPGEKPVTLVEHPLYGEALPGDEITGPVYYDCIDDLALYAGLAELSRYVTYQRRLVERSTAIFVTARRLEGQIRPMAGARPLVRIPNGVDAAWFIEKAAGAVRPQALTGVPGPVAGYIGMLYSWIDYELLAAAARSLPKVTFVLVGPIVDPERAAALRSLPNVLFPGRVPYTEVPAFVASFDVCLIPFRKGPIADTTNPVKVFEYFALGKPVLSTQVAELEPFAGEGLLRMAGGEEFVKVLGEMVREMQPRAGNSGGTTVAQRRRAVAFDHSWQVHVRHMLNVMAQRGR